MKDSELLCPLCARYIRIADITRRRHKCKVKLALVEDIESAE
jgi:hypothetical protein